MMDDNTTMPRDRRLHGVRMLIVAVLGLTTVNASAQIRIDGAPLVVSRSARGEALGYSYVSETTEATGMYWNPAMLAFTPGMQAVVGAYHLWNYSQLSVYGAVPLRLFGRHTFGLGYTQTALGNEWTAPEFVARSFDLAYSFKFSEVFSIGTMVNLNYGQTSSSEFWTASVAVGLFYLPTSGLRYGFTFEGLGTGLDYAQYRMYAIRNQTKILRMGVSYTYPVFRKDKLVTMTIAGEKWYGIASLHYYMGLELTPFSFVAFRIGYASKPEASVDYSSGGRYGIGIMTKYVHLDYAVSPSVSASRHHQMTLRTTIQ